jgi:transposase InsO family protein
MKKKSEVIEKFKEYKCLVEKKTERKIKTVRSDNGTEYTSHYLEDFLKQEGIRHELTVEYFRKEKQKLGGDGEVPDDPLGALRKFLG